MTDPRSKLQASLGDAYAIDRELGGGGMSHVYVATESGLGRKVVVKMLPAEMAGQVSIERFKREIALAARLQHPHIVPLLTAGESDGLPYFTMPLVEGESLRARLARQGELPMTEAIRLLREIASALAYAHERGIVHRDIKPDNVLLSGGSAMITDFGVAKALSASSNGDAGSMTSIGVALGTPAYMSPEQATADPAVDHRADIYSLGVLAYELLTGQPPFVGRNPQNLLAAHVTETPDHITRRRTAIPPALASLVMRCLEKRAADRPQMALEVVHALDAITTPSGGSAPTSAQLALPVTATVPAKSSARVAVFAAVAVVLLVATGWAAIHFTRGASSNVSRSIAVMPFEIGADTANAYLADGLSGELTTKLSKIPGLTVRPYSSSKAVRSKPLREAGSLLNVGTMLTATMQRSGAQLRVNATLVNVADDAVLWSDSFDENADNQFALQDKIATAIASALRISLTPAAKAAVASKRAVDPAAHELVQRARFLIDVYTDESIRAALRLSQEAIAKDSLYADAWATEAYALAALADDFEPPVKVIPQLRIATSKALALDPDLAEAHAQLAQLLMYYEWKPDDADREFKRALALDSTNVIALAEYPTNLMGRMMLDSAVVVALRSIRTNPSSPMARGYFPLTPHAFEKISPDSGAAICQRSATLSEYVGGVCESLRLLQSGRATDAIAQYLKTMKEPGTASAAATHARMFALLKDTVRTRLAIARALEISKTQYLREDFIALAYCQIGDAEESLRWWKRGYASRSAGVALAWASCPSLRADPRFRDAIGAENVPAK